MHQGLPDEFAAVELFPREGGGAGGGSVEALRLCVVVRRSGTPSLVMVEGAAFDERVVLGCEMDRGGRVHRWLDIHLQSVGGLKGAPPALREGASNAVLDERWRRLAAGAVTGLAGSGVVLTGFEEEHPLPVAIDLERMAAVQLKDQEGRPWQLCRDEGVLAAKGLPGYGASLHRYLYRAELGVESTMAPVTADAPTNQHTVALGEVLGQGMLDLNVGAGLMMVRERPSATYDAFCDGLSAEPAKAAMQLDPLPGGAGEGRVYRPLVDGGYMLSRQGRWGHLVEVLYLKLRLIADSVADVRSAVVAMQAPLLNLTSSSFGVSLGERGVALPVLWTARAVLVKAGESVPLQLPGADETYFVSPRAMSIYAPDSAGRAVVGRASLRVRKVASEARPGVAVVSGTLTTQERISPKASDLTWIRLDVGGCPVDLYARLEAQGAGEWRFATVPQAFGVEGLAALKGAEGVSVSDAPFQTLPLVSTPCDLYALGVLAARTLLVGGSGEGALTLPEALDELLSLARGAEEERSGEPGEGLAKRIASIMRREARWLKMLGPQRLAAAGGESPEVALDLVPMELWCDTLAAVIRMFPGVSDESACRDPGDAPAAGLQSVFDPARADFERLIVRTRSLIVVDWRQNREIHSIIRRHRTGLGALGAGVAS